MYSSSIIIAVPVFNDWESLSILLKRIDEVLDIENINAEILILNDGSTLSYQNIFKKLEPKTINQVSILDLKRNLGHQRAIAIGLAYIESKVECQAVVVMDSDGEDDPKDIPKLVYKCREENYSKIVFARRTQRSETWLFKVFYKIYKYLFKLLTGEYIEMGNFSIIPFESLRRIVVVSEIWNHYAAGILKARIPFTTVPCKRSSRITGQSKMNFVSLVMHGLSAISIYGDVIGTKALLVAILLMLLSVVIVTIIYMVRIAVPNWAPYIAGLSFIIFLQLITISFSFIFLILNGRNNFVFMPKRDFNYFILNFQIIFSKKANIDNYQD
ncbi:glycosyl transferase [Fischerella thermalis CCMEE 5282]|uniref:glycosyltransferase n=2 Tax=Fischerella thermalis TaxID=372787 RepID=UPI000C7FEF24|nr:glycosyltransferase [Fischerella thermalis]PMB12364.1 glycosyl transferase [Fischerella thermalis CCMEE 5282]